MHNERDAPEQVLLGAMDPVCCVLLGLAIYFELYIATGEDHLGEYDFCEAGCSPNSVKANAQTVLKQDILDNPAFQRVIQEGNLGSHSNQKFGSTYPHHCSCSKDDV